jgi:hypothetical protein
MSRECDSAERFIREKEQINVQARLYRKARLERRLSEQTASTNVVDMVECLRRINSELTSLGYAIVRDSIRSGDDGDPPIRLEDEMSRSETESQRGPDRAVSQVHLEQAANDAE